MSIIRPQSTITSEAALKAVAVGVAHGRENGVKIVVAVTDVGGNLMALLRGDGAFCASADIARDKAYTAAVFGCSTDQLNAAFGDNQVLRDGISSYDHVALFGGGFPIIFNGEVIGGIGASGGSEDEDRACAQAGLASIGLI